MQIELCLIALRLGLLQRCARTPKLCLERLDADIPLFEKRSANYEAGVKTLERECAGTFTARDRDAAKAKLGIQ